MNGQGLDNSGNLILAGGTLDGGGPLVNNATMSASGTISGSGGFTNNGSILQSGNLVLSNTGGNANSGTIDLSSGRQFTLSEGVSLSNLGTINLNKGVISGSGVLSNDSLGTINGPGTIDSTFVNSGLLSVPYGSTSITKSFVNSGSIQLGNSGAKLMGGAIDNQATGVIEGYGTVDNDISNTGRIEAIGSTLNLTGTVTNNAEGVLTSMSGRLFLDQGLATNSGLISLSGGPFDNNNHSLTNTGQISGYGSFSTGGLSNQNTINLAGGPATVNGPLTNEASGQVNITANSTFFTGFVTNHGTVKNTSATVTWAGGFFNDGAYISDPATQYFTDLTIGANGYIQGGKGDKFSLSGDFLNESTQNSLWDTTLADLAFTGGGTHQFSVSGNNHAWGSIDITGQSLKLVDGDNTPGGAFYVGQLLGLDLNGDLITNITGSPGLTMYYDPTLNSDLNGNYNFAEEGALNPGTVPLPASAWLFLTGLMGLGLLNRRRNGRASLTRVNPRYPRQGHS